eukprot:g3003.t1
MVKEKRQSKKQVPVPTVRVVKAAAPGTQVIGDEDPLPVQRAPMGGAPPQETVGSQCIPPLWPESNFVFPENAEEWSASLAQHLAGKEFGIALAGGGARGLALGHGILREMREAGLLEKAKYLSVTSGSVWLGIPFYYQTLDSLETYLGRTLPFDQMLPKTLLQETGTGISRLSELREYPKGHEPKRPRLRRLNARSAYQLWPLFSASIFLHPFELAGYDSVHCHESQLERMKKQFPSKTIYTAKDA